MFLGRLGWIGKYLEYSTNGGVYGVEVVMSFNNVSVREYPVSSVSLSKNSQQKC